MSKFTLRWTLFISMVVFISGCATSVPNRVSRTETKEKVFVKNYLVGQEQSVYVGEAVVRLKDYVVITTSLDSWEPVADFRANFGKWDHEFLTSQKYRIYESGIYKEQKYMLLSVPHPYLDLGFAFALEGDGAFTSLAFAKNGFGAWMVMPGEVLTDPPVSKLQKTVKKTVDALAGYENFEIIYNGTDGKSIFLTYREFTRDDIARQAFYQNLTYDTKVGVIRFKKYKIKVTTASNEKIGFVVEEDGH